MNFKGGTKCRPFLLPVNFVFYVQLLPLQVVILALNSLTLLVTGKNFQPGGLISMMNQNLVKPEFRSCFKCRFEGNVPRNICPRCGKRLYTATNVRWRGTILLLLGLFLIGLMGGIAVFVSMLLMQAAQRPENTAKFNQDEHLFLMVYIVFAGVIGMGVAAAMSGIWMLIFGKRNRYLFWLFMALLFLTLVVGRIFQGLTR